jgi:hypothetical protein
MSIPEEFERFSAPLLFYDGLNSKVIMGEQPEEGKSTIAVSSFERKFEPAFFEVLVDRDRYFVPRVKSVSAFDSFTGEEVLKVELESNLKRFDYFPRGKIVYTHCNSHTLTGNSYTNPSDLLVERILLLEGEGDLRVGQSFSVYSAAEEKGSKVPKRLCKWSLQNFGTSELKKLNIESASFLTSTEVLITFQAEKEAEGKKVKASFLVSVNIETGNTTSLSLQGVVLKPNGDLFALPDGGVGAYVKHGKYNDLIRVTLEEGMLKYTRLYPNITFEYVNFRIFPGGKLFAFLVDGDLLSVDDQGKFVQEEEQVIDSAVLSPTKVLVIEQPPLEVESDEKEVKVYNVATDETIQLEDLGDLGEVLEGETPHGILWIGNGFTCFYAERERTRGIPNPEKSEIFRIYGPDDPQDLKQTRENWETPLFVFEDARIERVIPLHGSKTWRKFIHDSLKEMTPKLPDALSGIIAKFI